MKLFRLEWKRMWRDKGFRFCLIFLVICAGLSVYYGTTQTGRQLRVIDSLEKLVTESDNGYFENRFSDEEDIGRAYYYLSQPTSHLPLPEAALSLGQRDLHSYHQSVRLRSLYANLFDGGFENPERLASGHFDLAFVLVFLLPLLIIAMSYDLFSKEKSERTLALVRSSQVAIGRLISIRLILRCLVVVGIVSLCLFLAFLYTGSPIGQLSSWLWVAVAYILFWFGLCANVVATGSSTPKSAGLLLGLWTLLSVVGPAFLSLALTRSATQSGAALTIQARQVLNDGWDREKSATLEMAAQRDERYLNAPVLGDEFTWSWYYAMHDAADQSVSEQADDYFQGLQQREDKVLSASIVFPSVRAQLLLEGLAGSDLGSHLDYYRFVQEVRKRMQASHLPRVFGQEMISKAELLRLHERLPIQHFTSKRRDITPYLATYWALGLLSFGLGLFMLLNLESRLRGKELG